MNWCWGASWLMVRMFHKSSDKHLLKSVTLCRICIRSFVLMRKEFGGCQFSILVADVSLAHKRHQGSFGFGSSLSLFNPSFMKGRPAQVATCSKGGSQTALEVGRDFLSHKFTTCLVSRLWDDFHLIWCMNRATEELLDFPCQQGTPLFLWFTDWETKMKWPNELKWRNTTGVSDPMDWEEGIPLGSLCLQLWL
jgi:hypothetical protein